MVDLSTRAFVLALKTYTTKTTAEIAAICGLSKSAINRNYGRVCERRFDPNLILIVVKDSYLEDAARAGRPPKQDQIKETVLDKIRRDRFRQEESYADLAGELSNESIKSRAWVRSMRCSAWHKLCALF
jgi:AcrR family transcriptional regulator